MIISLYNRKLGNLSFNWTHIANTFFPIICLIGPQLKLVEANMHFVEKRNNLSESSIDGSK